MAHSPSREIPLGYTKNVPLRIDPPREESQDLGYLAMSSSLDT